MTREEKLITLLFKTDAVRVCPEDKPFWYTSGTIGPYYVNTHFLYGSEDKANKLLQTIDNIKDNKLSFHDNIMEQVRSNYDSDEVYKEVIDGLCSHIRETVSLTEVSCISGGERRDWFFSILAAAFLNKPHMTIFKDLSAVMTDGGKTTKDFSLNGGKVLHIADLINEASSYERAWIPAVRNYEGDLAWSHVIVDRMQGGEELLKSHNVQSFKMIAIDGDMFSKAKALGLINSMQYSMLMEYIKDPKASMKKFLLEHPEFMQNALNGDKKTVERAKLCMEKNFYDLT